MGKKLKYPTDKFFKMGKITKKNQNIFLNKIKKIEKLKKLNIIDFFILTLYIFSIIIEKFYAKNN